MSTEKGKDKVVKDAHVLLHPIRFQIVELLAEKPGLHISALSKAMGEERRLVTYHLNALEEAALLVGKYEISELPKSKGKALRVFTVTDKVNTVIAGIKERLPSVA